MNIFQTPGPDYSPGPYQFFSTPQPSFYPDVESTLLPDAPTVTLPPDFSYIEEYVSPLSESFDFLSQQFEELASQVTATQGYMNSNTFEILSSVVLGSSLPYYVAYRYDDDAYNAYLYLCSDYVLSGFNLSLKDTVFVQVYRYRPSTSSSWQYLYHTQAVGDVDLTLGQYSTLYTNIIPNYPILGNKLNTDTAVSSNILPFLAGALIVFFIARIFRRH